MSLGHPHGLFLFLLEKKKKIKEKIATCRPAAAGKNLPVSQYSRNQI